MHATLIKNGTVVTARDTYRGRRPRSRTRRSSADRRRSLGDSTADRTIDATGKYVLPGGIDVAHAPRHAVRRHDVGRRLRDGHDRRGARRHDVDRRLRDPVQGPDAARRRWTTWTRQGRGQGGHRLRLPHDHHRPDRPGRARRWTRWSARASRPSSSSWPTRGVLMLDDGVDLPRAAAGRRERRHDLHARRERRRHRRARASARWPRGTRRRSTTR